MISVLQGDWMFRQRWTPKEHSEIIGIHQVKEDGGRSGGSCLHCSEQASYIVKFTYQVASCQHTSSKTVRCD